MMYIFASIKALEKLVLAKKWNRILSTREVNFVYVDEDQATLDKYYKYNPSDPQPIPELLVRYNIQLISVKGKADAIRKENQLVLNHPSAVYFLNIPKNEAFAIQRKFGVICRNEDDIKDNELIQWKEVISCKDEIGICWEQILKGIKQSPTNSLIISDRYIFSSDKNTYGYARGSVSGDYNGRKNLIDIINAILPDTFGNYYYDVLILFSWLLDVNGRNCPISFEDIAKEMIAKITKLRPYHIRVEIISVPFGSDGYKYTHNRRIITNYHVLRVEQDLKAFNNNVSLCTQTINWDSLFSKVMHNGMDVPYKNYRLLIDGIKKINLNDSGKKNNYEYSENVVCKSHVKAPENSEPKINNRLVNRGLK